MNKKFARLALLLSVVGVTPAPAQEVNDFIRLFGGLAQSAAEKQKAKTEWRKLTDGERNCIDKALLGKGVSIKKLLRAGVLPSDPSLSEIRSTCLPGVEPATARPKSPYSVDGLALGDVVHFESTAYRAYHCTESNQFPNFIWCQKQSKQRSGRQPAAVSHSILQRSDGTTVYVNKFLRPAFLNEGAAAAEVERLSSKFGEEARVQRSPRTAQSSNGIIATWGKVQLVAVGSDTVAKLAAGEDAKAGLLIDFIGDFSKSAKLGLPIYRLSGGAGYVWRG